MPHLCTSLNTSRPRDELYLTGDYNPGVRVRLGYQMCDWFSDISYLYFRSTDDVSEGIDDFNRMSLAGEPPSSNISRVIAAESFATFRYQNVDGRFGSFFCFKQDFNVFLYGNVRWIKIDFKNFTQGPSENVPSFIDFLKQDSHFKGGGIGLGVGGRYDLCGGFSFHGNTGIMGIIGETELKNYSSNFIDDNEDVHSNFLDRPQRWTHIIPAFTFCIGLDYVFCWCSYILQAEIGYEFDFYTKVLKYASDNLIPTFNSAEIPLLSCQDVVFGGPYFNLTIGF